MEKFWILNYKGRVGTRPLQRARTMIKLSGTVEARCRSTYRTPPAAHRHRRPGGIWGSSGL